MIKRQIMIMYYKQLEKMILLLFMCAMANIVSAERLVFKVGDNGSDLNSNSAAPEVQSNDKGFLLPRMSRQQPDTIASPVTSLLVWCTDCDSSTDQSPDNFVFGWMQDGFLLPRLKIIKAGMVLFRSLPAFHVMGAGRFLQKKGISKRAVCSNSEK